MGTTAEPNFTVAWGLPRLPFRRFLLGCCTPRLEFVTILSPPGFMP
jgi:hypothetical protein